MNNSWICSKCGYSWSPGVEGCQNCNRPDHEKYQTASALVFDPPCTCAPSGIPKFNGRCCRCGGRMFDQEIVKL